ncbi:winged helix-turn-helix domain-containing protein [Vibrio anguillarum]|uniref:winged helix-turn-helix domain-containing protein n=1 Tax=Vibrio anguillarum TaxID=55601 RepID=UPI002FE4374F
MTIQYKHSDKFIFEPETFRLILETKELKLSHKESAVLEQLCSNAMRVVERRTLLTQIWGDRESSDISLNKNILLLRRKFESIGIKNAIDTVPRVGYILKLDLETMQGDSLAHREEIIDESIDAAEEAEIEIVSAPKNNKLGMKSFLAVLTIIITVVFLIISINVFSKKDSANLPEISLIKPDNQEQDRTILYTSDISENDYNKYIALSDYITRDLTYYALVSNEAISFINLGDGKKMTWQKTFLMDKNKDISSQIKCIAGYINNYQAKPINVKKVPGMSFVRLNFYRPCSENNYFVGTMLIKSTTTDDRTSTWTQDFSFTDRNDNVLFHLKRHSRAYNSKKAMHLNIKSFHVDFVKQESLQIDSDLNRIFNQFTQDDIYLQTVDKKNKIYASSVFSGIIFHVDEFLNKTE